jgi:hypothetical protein
VKELRVFARPAFESNCELESGRGALDEIDFVDLQTLEVLAEMRHGRLPDTDGANFRRLD